MKDAYLEYFEISRLLVISEKNLFRTSAISNSVLTDSPFSDKFILSLVMTLPDNDGFIKVCYQGYLFHLSLQNISF